MGISHRHTNILSLGLTRGVVSTPYAFLRNTLVAYATKLRHYR